MKLYCPLLLICLFSFLSAASQPINTNNFEGYADETIYTRELWQADGFTVPWVNGFNQERARIDDAFSRSGNKSLRILFPKDQYGPDNGGAQAPLKVPGELQYYISYWLRFSDNFSWGNTSEGGKLPGLAGGNNCSGCNTCNGTNGFSARLMWRTGGAAVLYLYHMDKEQTCGDNFNMQVVPGQNFRFQRGHWYQITERVKINTGSANNGEVELWINQQQALVVTGLKFVTNGGLVDNLYFSTFHGGSTAAWAPIENCYIWFDDIIITTNPADIFTITAENKHSQKKPSPLISPNPLLSGQDYHIELNDVLQIEWFDITGKKVLSTEKNSVVPTVKPGVYTIKITTKNKIFIEKVVIK
ncbi:MAG: T9SS type A sorting domain-containing protein [Cytophagaceae bacterium]